MSRRHHDALAGSERRPADLDEPVGVVEQPELDARPADARPPRRLLDRVAAARRARAARSTGTTSAFLTLAVVIETSTGAWSSRPVAAGSVGVTSTSIVGELDPPPPPWSLDGVVATVPT